MHRSLTMALMVTLISLSIGALSAHALSVVVQLAGTAIVGEMREIDTDGDGVPDKEANCFEMPLVDPNTGLQVGTGSDCLSDMEVLNPDDPDCNPENSLAGCAVRLIDTAILELNSGTIVSQGAVSIPVVLDDDTRNAGISHITGSFPTDNNILYGTGSFENVQGRVRVSGGVDMTNTVAENEITFDCFFYIQTEETTEE